MGKINKSIFCLIVMKDIVVDLLIKEVGLERAEIESLIEVPPKLEMGDFAFPCFSLAKKMKKSPVQIAEELASKIKGEGIERIESAGPYVNFFVDRKKFTEDVLGKVSSEDFGKNDSGKGKKIGIEYPSPNTNKPLHVGHLRNMSIGNSVIALSKNSGAEVFHLNLFNDRGILISKSMVGYERFAKGKSPKSEGVKGDRFVGNLYVKFSKESKENPELEELAKEKLRLWEAGDKDTLKLWKEMNGWVYSGMRETFDLFGLDEINTSYYESELYMEGRGLVEKGLKDKVFVKKGGAVVIDLSEEKLGEKVLLRSDGTSVYMTQDLYLAEKKVEDFKLDSSYYIVGSDQEYHFKVLFSILDKLGFKKDWRHLSYGMVTLPSGKMSSREGTAIYADDLMNDAIEIARKGIVERADGEVSDLEERSKRIALAAIKYSLLKVDIHRGIAFDVEKALSFEGDTGPYLLYSYARASSILRKVGKKISMKVEEPEEIEFKLVKKLGDFEEVVLKAARDLAPNLVANYCYELARDFNEFYHACPVLGGDKEAFRLELVSAFRDVLGRGLDLLGIEKLEEM